MKTCDFGHQVKDETEIRLLPTSNSELHGNVIVCYYHYLLEINERVKNQLDNDMLPSWCDLKLYKEE